MSWQKSYDLLEDSLAACPAVRTFLGAGDATAAKARIYQDVLPPPTGTKEVHTQADMVALRPYVLLSSEDAFSKYRQRRRATGCWIGSGSMWVKLARNVPSGETPEQAQVSFRTAVAAMIDELAALADNGTAEYLAAIDIEAEGPYRVHQAEVEAHGDYDWVILRVSWGLE